MKVDPEFVTLTDATAPPPLRGQVLYEADSYAFNFVAEDKWAVEERIGQYGSTSLVLNTLQIELTVRQGLLLYVWGYCPHTSWTGADLAPPSAHLGAVFARTELAPGISVGVEKESGWRVFFNPGNGWFKVGSRPDNLPGKAVEFAQGTVAVIEGVKLQELWMHPHNWYDLDRFLFERPA